MEKGGRGGKVQGESKWQAGDCPITTTQHCPLELPSRRQSHQLSRKRTEKKEKKSRCFKNVIRDFSVLKSSRFELEENRRASFLFSYGKGSRSDNSN